MSGVKSILVVNDSLFERLALSRLVERFGYTAVAAASGVEALDLVEECTFDLVLLALVMPLLNGFEVLTQMRKRSELAHMPIVVMAGPGSGEELQCRLAGADQFLPWPLDALALGECLKNCLEKDG